MRPWIKLCTGAPHRMNDKVRIIAWWLNIKRMNGQMESEWEWKMWQTGRQVRLGEGKEACTAQGGTGFILTYALEWNEDWHDLLIGAVTAHGGHGRSPVTPFRAQRMSCHQDRSKIKIHFLLGVDSNRTSGFHLSPSLPYLLGTCCSLRRYWIIQYRRCFCLLCFSIVFCFKLRAVCFEGEEGACFSTDLENVAHQHRISIMLKKNCFDTSSGVIFLIGDSSKLKKNMKKFWSTVP